MTPGELSQPRKSRVSCGFATFQSRTRFALTPPVAHTPVQYLFWCESFPPAGADGFSDVETVVDDCAPGALPASYMSARMVTR